MRPILTDSLEQIVSQSGNVLNAYGNFQPEYSTTFDSFVSAANTGRDYDTIYTLERYLRLHNLYDSMLRIWPTYNKTKASRLVEYKSASSLTVSGDVNYGNGIAGNGSDSYFDTAQNFSTKISDIDNFSMGIVSQSNSNGGVDFGATDGTNEVSISIRDADNATFKCGTAQIQDSNTYGYGHFILNSYAGTVRGYRGALNTLAEVSSGDTVAGSLPNYSAYIGALNSSGTDANHSSKYYSTIWIYNGPLDTAGVININNAIMSFEAMAGHPILE